MLIWLPRSPGDALSAPPQLKKDFQRDWFNGLRDAMFGNFEMQGYLYKSDDLWRIAGAHCREYFEKYCSAVLACFNSATMSGRELIFHSAQVELIRNQLAKIRKENTEPVHSHDLLQYSLFSNGLPVVVAAKGRASPSSTASVVAFDVDCEFKKERRNAPENRRGHGYTQADFDARDLRKLAEGYKDAEKIIQAQPWLKHEDVLEIVCRRVGVRFEKALELELSKRPERSSRALAKGAAACD